MIARDQPSIFPQHLLSVGLSSVADGSMKDGVELLSPVATKNRQKFLNSLAMPVENAATFAATFEGNDFCRYDLASPGVQLAIDALATNIPGQPIIVPLADCTGAIFYDRQHHAVMLSHLGRHSTEQLGVEKSIAYMAEQFSSKPAELSVWLSPAPSEREYPLHCFDGRGFNAVHLQHLLAAGVARQAIEICATNTTDDANYFSHSRFLQGRQSSDGRYALAVMLR